MVFVYYYIGSLGWEQPFSNLLETKKTYGNWSTIDEIANTYKFVMTCLSNTGWRLANRIKDSGTWSIKSHANKHNNETIVFALATKKNWESIKGSTYLSSGSDHIHPTVLTAISPLISLVLQ